MNTLLKILAEVTSLTKDVDLFAYEIPLATGGLWIADAQTISRFNDSGRTEYDCYYRGKDKAQSISNISYLKETIDALPGSNGTCELEDGTQFRLTILYTWDFLEKDSEGYFVWANRLAYLT